MPIALDEKKIKSLVKEGVKEAMSTQIIKLGAFLVAHISEKEQKDIARFYRRPLRKAVKSYRAEL